MPVTSLVPIVIYFVLSASVSSLTYATTPELVIPVTVKESRYVSLRAEPTVEQWDVLQSVITVVIPNTIKTVGEALQYLLAPYGFQVDVSEVESQSKDESLPIYVLLTRQMPEPHRHLGPVTLQDALDVLGGNTFETTINPVLRTISYRLKPAYQGYISDKDLEEAKASWLNRKDESIPEVVERYGPVEAGETLSDIVEQLMFPNLTLNQALVYVFRSNPSAFANNNMNHLLVGEYLSVPFPRDDVLTAAAASRLVDEQYRAWQHQQVQP